MNMDSISEYAREHLSAKRWIHTQGVRDTAVQLAQKYGADPNKAIRAALYHDLYRGVPLDVLDQYVEEFGLDPGRYKGNANLAHGKIAAAVIQRDLGETDQDVINAVSYHTTGRAGMSQLEKVIFIADAIEPSRDYPGVEELRRVTEEDLDRGCLLSLTRTAEYVLSQSNYLDPDTLEAKEYFERKLL